MKTMIMILGIISIQMETPEFIAVEIGMQEEGLLDQ